MRAKKWIAAGLAALALFSVVACQTSDGEPKTTKGEVVTQGGYDGPSLDYDFGGKTYEFGSMTDGFNGYDYRLSIVAPEGSADIVDVAVLDRNTWVEDNLNCKITTGDIHYGNWNTILANIMSGDCTFDTMLLQFSSTCDTYIVGGYYSDMKALDINWDEEYWNPEANKSLELLGKQYCAVTDISYLSFYGYTMVAFNKTIEDELLVNGRIDKGLYQTVNDGEWTLDKMTAIGRQAVKDVDGNGIDFLSDRFGFNANLMMVRALMVAGDYRFTEINEDGELVSAIDERSFEKYFSKIFTLYTEDGLLACSNLVNVDWREVCYVPLQENRLLFMITTFPGQIRTEMTAGNYGFLPMPKSTETQERYLTPAGAWNGAIMGMPRSTPSSEYEFISAVLNAMAYKSYIDVNEAFYNYALNYKHAQDDESIEMFRIIRNGITFDYAIGFNFADCCDNLDTIISRGINTFASTYNGMKDAVNAEIEELMAKLTG